MGDLEINSSNSMNMPTFQSSYQSNIWAFPFKGIWYTFSHASIFCVIICPFLILSAAYGSLVLILITFTYTAQKNFLINFMDEWIAETYAVSLCLFEAEVLYLILTNVIMDQVKRDIFDLVFKMEGREMQSLHTMPKKTSLKVSLWSTIVTGILLVFCSPINLIPGGSIIYLICLGWACTWSLQSLYLTFVGMNLKLQLKWIWKRLKEYTLFGVPALVLKLIPGLNLIFYFTNICGCALWSVEMEKNNAFGKALNESKALLAMVNPPTTDEEERFKQKLQSLGVKDVTNSVSLANNV